MFWYAIYRYTGKSGEQTIGEISGPYVSEEKAYLKLSELGEENPDAIPWDVYGTFTHIPQEALDEFLGERERSSLGGYRESGTLGEYWQEERIEGNGFEGEGVA